MHRKRFGDLRLKIAHIFMSKASQNYTEKHEILPTSKQTDQTPLSWIRLRVFGRKLVEFILFHMQVKQRPLQNKDTGSGGNQFSNRTYFP